MKRPQGKRATLILSERNRRSVAQLAGALALAQLPWDRRNEVIALAETTLERLRLAAGRRP